MKLTYKKNLLWKKLVEKTCECQTKGGSQHNKSSIDNQLLLVVEIKLLVEIKQTIMTGKVGGCIRESTRLIRKVSIVWF